MKKPVIIALHIGYWIMFLLLLLVFFLLIAGPQLHLAPNKGLVFFGYGRMMFGFAIVPGLIGFYSFYTFLFSRFLNRKKLVPFFLYAILVSVIAALAGDLLMSALLSPHILFNDNLNSAITITEVIAFGALANGIIGLVMKGFITWYGDIKLKEELNKKNYETELALVKSQINPHFLFNTINNIDVLIEKDPTKASAYLNKLSDIMRFMLYETKTDRIPLAKELAYIDKYVELQKIRTSNSGYVNYQVEGDPGNLQIAPMLFIPFIENAFKHAEDKKIENAIRIRIKIKEEMITFECENHYTEIPAVKPEQGGLGNELIRKRLRLLYPGKNTLDVSAKNNMYNVNLSLNVREN